MDENLNILLEDVAKGREDLVALLHFLGIKYFRDESLRSVCKQFDIEEDYLLAIISVFSDRNDFKTSSLSGYSLLKLFDLINSLYEFYGIYYCESIETLNKNSFTSDIDVKVLTNKIDKLKKTLGDNAGFVKNVVLSHCMRVYELYYSPGFTSKNKDLLDYSIEFYKDDFETLLAASTDFIKFIECTEKSNMGIIVLQKMIVFNKMLLVQNKIEQNLLKPIVLQMEGAVISTLQKKSKVQVRNNYIPLSINDKKADDVLSNREKDVLKLVALGFINKEIASQLNIALTTVITHRKNITEKLCIKSISGLTVYAYKNGYIDDSILINED